MSMSSYNYHFFEAKSHGAIDFVILLLVSRPLLGD